MDNVFLGSESIILPDVKIGPNAVVTAGAVVTRNVPEGTIVAGDPAKVIGKFDDLLDRRMDDVTKIDKYERTKKLWDDFNAKHHPPIEE